MDDDHLPSICENCSDELRGQFCSSCGQRVETLPTGVFGYLHWLGSGIIGYDSRVLRSLGSVLFRPGLLTLEYLRGRRVHYLDPLQIYLLSAAAFFLVHAYRPFVQFDIVNRGASSSLGMASATGGLPDTTVERLAVQGISLEVFAERFDAWVSAYLPVLLLVLLAVFTVLIWLMNRRSRKPFAAHVAFTLHWSAFYLTIRGVHRIVPLPETWENGSSIAVLLISLIYLAIALRRVYGGGWPVNAVKAVVGIVLFGLLIAAWMASAIGLAVFFA